MKISKITPYEYLEDGYREKVKAGEVLIWYRSEDDTLYTVKGIQKNKHDVSIITRSWTWSSTVRFRASMYDDCLNIIPLDYDAIRQQLAEIMIELPDGEALYMWLNNNFDLEMDE